MHFELDSVPCEQLETYFLPAERMEKNEIRRLRRIIHTTALLRMTIDGMPEGVLVLNKDRQIVCANKAMIEAVGLPDEEPVLGLRPGEALKCVHSGEHLFCGTTQFCRYCGAAQVLYNCGLKKNCSGECRIIIQVESATDALDLLVWGTPFNIGNDDFILFAIADISHEKRRRILERIFFHDVLNTANGIMGLSEVIQESNGENVSRQLEVLNNTSVRLVNEIVSQKMLLEAETRELAIRITEVDPYATLDDICRYMSKTYASRNKKIELDDGCAACGELTLKSDASLINRCLENLIKNALEASGPGETVTVGVQATDDRVIFSVHNGAHIPEPVRMQVFSRSYSTKGVGRGLGLYSVRLFAEGYLQGRVSFESTEAGGTVFQIDLPRTLRRQPTNLC